MFDFSANSIWVNLGIFVGAVIVIWFAGVRLERYVEGIADKTGLQKAFAGFLLLAGATSLPEVATTISGALIGNAPLVVNNLTGGIAMQTAILVLADYTMKEGALTYFTPRFSLLIQGVSLVLLLGLTAALLAANGLTAFFAVGTGAVLLFMAYVVAMYLSYQYSEHPRWVPKGSEEENEEREEKLEDISERNNRSRQEERGGEESNQSEGNQEGSADDRTLAQLLLYFGITCAIVFVAGWTVARVADALAQQTGMDSSFVGAVFVAISTSMPEISTTIAAAKRGQSEIAVSNIFGSNAFMIALLLLGDIFYRKGSILAGANQQAIFTTTLGIVVTCVYLYGLLEWRNRTIMRVGVDSAMVLILYLSGLAVLYFMK